MRTVEKAVQKRPADDRGFDADRRERGEIVARTDTTGGEHRPAEAPHHALQQREVRACERAVAVDGRAEQPRDAGPTAEVDGLVDAQPAAALPTVRPYVAVTDVHSDDEPLPEGVRIRLRALLERRRPDDHTRHAGRHQPLGVADAADAAAELHGDRSCRRHELGAELDRSMAVAGGVEDDDVEEGRVGGSEAPHELDGIARLPRHGVEVAALEADGAAFEDVDGRDDLQLLCHRVTMLTR